MGHFPYPDALVENRSTASFRSSKGIQKIHHCCLALWDHSTLTKQYGTAPWFHSRNMIYTCIYIIWFCSPYDCLNLKIILFVPVSFRLVEGQRPQMSQLQPPFAAYRWRGSGDRGLIPQPGAKRRRFLGKFWKTTSLRPHHRWSGWWFQPLLGEKPWLIMVNNGW